MTIIKVFHKHSYNALGGVGIIIGQVTRKLLHIGIRNKYCYACSLAESRQKDPECFKNWDESSQAMEADVIVEGFMNAEKDHGVRYMRLVADGDSSVYARIQETVPIWGPHVTKLECANHACKCLRSSLEKMVDRLPKLRGRGKLTLATRIRIVSAVRCAIRMRSSEENRSLACKKSVHDIKNCIYHVFGDHTRCSEFCKKSSGEIPSKESNPTSTCEDEQSESVISVVRDQQDFWTDGSSLKDQEDSRLAVPGRGLSAADNEIINEVCPLLNRIASKAERLLGNFTTNLAEAWMNIRAKFDGGKFFNRCSRGSWHCRCYGGALRQNQVVTYGLDKVRSISPHQLHIERIVVDKNLWVTKMLPKLTAFYYTCLLPELCAPKYGKSSGIREPGVWDTKPKQESFKPNCSGTKPQTTTRSTNRAARQRFVGREISHKWIVDESSDNCKWYRGSVLDVTSGLDGNPDAVYDIYYHSEDETYSINHLVQDFGQIY
ncbi:hypothetical protein LOTGIDRAFT_154561 [Lottia gigantea]|uniref:Mutator-like transposase domain-containing protein n=1 Tax=Lottia gigantea TaxID=225164 RepID=V4A1A4_LOTGI|nr:hypothetical protein LOTGIDRAFT_154561 [Lottia gigantea]ESO87071.1 hypothetical protein LOTGIDRAFT_154561 [Lottia gigantea]